jgi:hypothetical protein
MLTRRNASRAGRRDAVLGSASSMSSPPAGSDAADGGTTMTSSATDSSASWIFLVRISGTSLRRCRAGGGSSAKRSRLPVTQDHEVGRRHPLPPYLTYSKRPMASDLCSIPGRSRRSFDEHEYLAVLRSVRGHGPAVCVLQVLEPTFRGVSIPPSSPGPLPQPLALTIVEEPLDGIGPGTRIARGDQ